MCLMARLGGLGHLTAALLIMKFHLQVTQHVQFSLSWKIIQYDYLIMWSQGLDVPNEDCDSTFGVTSNFCDLVTCYNHACCRPKVHPSHQRGVSLLTCVWSTALPRPGGEVVSKSTWLILTQSLIFLKWYADIWCSFFTWHLHSVVICD